MPKNAMNLKKKKKVFFIPKVELPRFPNSSASIWIRTMF